ncbi:transporter substrate-binding domain-containing protein [Pararhizobium gei]|uniref:transporter substrate-binding domain-containing protein n=1 Tax=Pararhizobium gei TaxID=1395951 RepID=UPI0023D99E43|nr:transporter substrate-binding domain-containing protein [Rhizobium gei]
MVSGIRAPLKIKGILTICVSLVVSFLGVSHAAEKAGELPVLFDLRERIARPDLSGLARLRFLTTVDFPPFNFIDQSGRLAGFHIDLAREICRELEIEDKCQIQAVTFGELQPALEGGQGEAVIAGIATKAELRQSFLFSRPYLHLPARFAANRQAMGEDMTVNGLNGKLIGTVAGTTHEAMLKSFFPKLDIASFADRPAMLAALRQKKVAAVFSDGMQLSFWTASAEAAGCCALLDGAYVSQRFLGEGLSIMNRRNEPALTQAIDHALLELSRKGRLNEIYLRYFPAGLF